MWTLDCVDFQVWTVDTGPSTKQGLDLWTCGLVNLWTDFFLNFTKIQKSIAAQNMIFLLICTMPHCRALPEREIQYIPCALSYKIFIRCK